MIFKQHQHHRALGVLGLAMSVQHSQWANFSYLLRAFVVCFGSVSLQRDWDQHPDSVIVPLDLQRHERSWGVLRFDEQQPRKTWCFCETCWYFPERSPLLFFFWAAFSSSPLGYHLVLRRLSYLYLYLYFYFLYRKGEDLGEVWVFLAAVTGEESRLGGSCSWMTLRCRKRKMETLVWEAICEIQSPLVDSGCHLREPSRLSLMIMEFCAEKGFWQKKVAEHVLIFAFICSRSVVIEEPFLWFT